MMVLVYGYAAVVGVCIGSFLNVVVYRLPLNKSVVWPGSCCPSCTVPISKRHMVPVLSYVWLRGRCAACRASIPWAYVAIELGTALVFAGLVYGFGWSVEALRYAVLAAVVIAAAEIDRQHGIIPNRLVAAGAVLGLALVGVTEQAALGTYVLAAGASGGLLLLIREGSYLVFGRAGMGMGDVKLAAMMGLYLGWATLWVFYLAVMIGGIIGLAGLLTGRLSRTSRLPFAPFLAAGVGLHLFVVPPSILSWFLW